MVDKGLDIYDLRILNCILDNPEILSSQISKYALIASPSSISKRKKKLITQGIIKRFVAQIDYEAMGFKYPVVIFVKAKFKENYIRELGEKLKKMPGTIWVYNISGDIDFILYAIYKDRNEYLKILDVLTSYNEIERTDTRQLHRIIKDMDFKLIIEDMINNYNK